VCRERGLHINKNSKRHWHLCRRLECFGLSLQKATDISTAKSKTRKIRYRLVMMDFETLGKEIYDFCRFIRKGNPYSVIIATANRIAPRNEERLFESGVNDVVTGKQLTCRLLAKRVCAHLCYCSQQPLVKNNKIRLKNTIIDFDRDEVWCNGTVHRLRGIQTELLKYFLEHPGQVITRDELMASPIWADSVCSAANEGGKTFDVNIGKLRKVIEPDPKNPELIKSVRGKGWILGKDIFVQTNKDEQFHKQT
jgi:two-component system OmpR family response regulator